MNHRYNLKSGVVLLIREAEESDAKELVAFVDEISGETEYLSIAPGDFDTSVEEERRILKDFKESPGKVFITAVVNGRIVGNLSFSNGKRKRMQHYGEFGMSVLKEYWGHGIGSILMDHLIEWAKGTELITKINLQVRYDNQRAINLYLKKGFQFEGTTKRGIRIKEQYFDVYWMGLNL